MTLVPAYGRDYRSAAQVREAFEGGKDFEIASIGPDMGRYVNKPQLVEAKVGEVMIRYARLTKIVAVKVK
jgi:hypothetical protein